MFELDFTHDPKRNSWVESANDPKTDFPIQNLPLGLFETEGGSPRIGIGIGDQILDAISIVEAEAISDSQTAATLRLKSLKGLMSLSKKQRVELRHALSNVLAADSDIDRSKLTLVSMAESTMRLPCEPRDFTDFYASVYHATNVGSMFRPDNPLLPNYKHIPIGYHGRASSIIASGQPVQRPIGQKPPTDSSGNPDFGPSERLDYEFEVGFFVAQGNELGSSFPIDQAEDHIFGMVLVNDWSARDLQKWEYQPLGPFLAKSFATSVSSWIVTMEALAPFRCPAFKRVDGDPQPLPYLNDEQNTQSGGVRIQLEASLTTAQMRKQGDAPFRLSKTTSDNIYWTIAQMLTHHSSNGCNMQPGDLLASGTVSGPTKGERGCLLELTWNGDLDDPRPGNDRTPLQLPSGEKRTFLADGDEVIFSGHCESETHRRIGFGVCRGTVHGVN